MKNKYLKILLLISLAVIMALSLISCGSSASNASDANGGWEGISWDYKKDTKTLTITGSGKMPNAESSDKVSWAAVRDSVEKIVFVAKDGENITSVGNYAFFGMGKLKSVTLPGSVTSIGKCAFAFCSSLESISVPLGVTTVGESAFEACVALKSVTLPESVTKVGDRAFAYCRELTSATIAGNVEKIELSIFTDCSKLTSVTVRQGLEAFDEAPFKKAGIKVDYIEGLSDTTTIVTYYKDTDGNEIKDKKEEIKNYGESYSTVAPTIEGYNIKGEKSYNGKVNGEKRIEKVFVYEKIVETEAPEVPAESDAPSADKDDENEGLTAEHIIGIVVLVVVIAGICVGAVLLARSNKKQQKGSTVRKNQSKKK